MRLDIMPVLAQCWPSIGPTQVPDNTYLRKTQSVHNVIDHTQCSSIK